MTAWSALTFGELVNVDGCIRIRDKEMGVDHALVWTPDTSVVIEGDEVRVTTGIVRGSPSKVVLHFGDMIRVGGGETMHPDEELMPYIHPNCQAPYWVVGFGIDAIQPTEEPQ